MKNLKTWLTATAVIAFSVARGQQTSNFSFEPQKPQPGETVAITYGTTGTPLAGKKSVQAVVYLYQNYHWQTADLIMKPAADNKFIGTITLDKNFGLAAIKFMAGESTDNNQDMGYVIMASAAPGIMYNPPGAYAAWGLLRASRYGYGVPNYFKSPRLTDTAFYYWMNNEIVRHPKESSAALAVPFAKSVYAYQKESSIPRINNVIKFLNQLGGEENQLKIREIYGEALGRKSSVDSLDALMLTQYPKGSVAALYAYRKFNSERDLTKKRELAAQFLTNFPLATANAGFDEQNNLSYANMYQTLIILNVMNNNYDVLGKYVKEMPYAALIGTYYKIIEIAHNRKDVADEKLYPYAKMLVDQLITYRDNKPAEYWYLSPSQWSQQFDDYFIKSVLVTHVNLLKNVKRYDDALKYAQQAQAFLQYKRANLNNDEIFLLKQKGDNKAAEEVLVKSIYENQATPEMLDMLKADYIAQYKTEDGFDKYLESMKNAALSKASAEHMEMINKEMPDWAMRDAAGKLIKFADLRGKTIVMDFWATWCVPCKASFPGMKLAVEKYKNDPNVEFFFIDTEERTANYKAQVNKYIKDNNYPFHILFDNKAGDSKLNDEVYLKICKAFTISGIPQKLIIDKNGKLRFIAVGYNGSASELSDEISAMVEATKKVN